ncbi:glycosyltransferase [Oceanotoga sp. DSM 15011]|uniref:glycosyltransferase n=1 Tax=Oceanotoga sp. DSM 15011 TaxID=2984951 RepID=UPI0021F431AA|nr:glycosyltransferase [Oceanotoga sp. DSM 15011]UYO99162.1 glycosyltransferase [Oceanotoga sp. DSM 15011]
MKKIILISGIIGPIVGSNQSFTNTINGYLKRNYKVYHFAFFNKNNKKYDIEKLLKNKNYKFYGISKIFRIKNKNKKNVNFITLPKSNEIIIPESEINYKQKLFYYFYNIFETLRILFFIPFIKPDLIYSYEVFSVIPGYIISKIINKPLIKRFQGTFINKNNIESKKINFHKKAYKKDCLLNVMANDGTKGDIVLKKLGFKEEKILFLLNGLDERMKNKLNKNNINKLKLNLNLKDKDIVLGIFNRFYPFKRVDRAFYLINELKKFINNPYLLVGGLGGPMEMPIKKYVVDNDLEENVKFLGQIKYENMKSYYECCDIVLILNDYANTGNQIIETSYLGKETIAINDENNSKYLNYDNIHYINPHNFLEDSVNQVINIYKKR